MAHRPTVARSPSTVERLVKTIRRHPTRATLVAAALVSSIVFAVQTWRHIGQLKMARDLAEASRLEAEASAIAARQQERIANEFLYASRMSFGFQWLESGDVEQVSKLLDSYEAGGPLADLRGFEWFHLKRRLHEELLTLRGHRGEVYGVTFSPDGRV